MLGWSQAVASERELFYNLYGSKLLVADRDDELGDKESKEGGDYNGLADSDVDASSITTKRDNTYVLPVACIIVHCLLLLC